MRGDQCGVANPDGVVAETDGVATEVSGAVGAVVGVMVCPVVTSGGSTRCGAPVMPPATPTPSTAVANPPMAPTPISISDFADCFPSRYSMSSPPVLWVADAAGGETASTRHQCVVAKPDGGVLPRSAGTAIDTSGADGGVVSVLVCPRFM